VLISLFGDYILLILYVYAIRKKYFKSKRKTLFGLRFFYLSRGKEKEKKGEKSGEEKQRKSNTLTG